MKGSNTRARGFTLIELLVALILFALLMVSAFQLFDSVLTVNERSQASFDNDNRLALAWSVMFQDMVHLRNRPHRDIQGDKQPAFETTQYELVRFVRGGYPPVAGITPGGLLRVAYVLNDEGELIRQSWAVIDLANDSEPRTQVLLRGVEALELAFLDDSDQYSEVWPPANTGAVTAADNADNATALGPLDIMPRMIRITLRLRDGREMMRLLPGVGG